MSPEKRWFFKSLNFSHPVSFTKQMETIWPVIMLNMKTKMYAFME